jgi:hypothetical protein
MTRNLLSKVRWAVYPSFSSLRWRWQSRNRDWVMGRVACMGQDVYDLLNTPLPLMNVQKGRVDYLLETTDNPQVKTRTSQIAPFMERRDVIGLIAEQESWDWFSNRPPLALYMDSYSELTDQLFVHREYKWQFCCNYSDLNHTPEFESQFETLGLLPVEDLLKFYRSYFGIIRRRWREIPIVFLHFPTKLDKREKFKSRSRKILESITQISQEFQPFYSLTLDDSVVDWPETKIPGLENFPYHYNQRTYQVFAEQVRATGVFQTLEKNEV